MGGADRPGEFALIAELLAPLADNPTARRLTDDAAAYAPPPGHDLIISADALVAGVHFPNTAPPDLAARRALACNLSDLAAKGAEPAGCLLTLGVGPEWNAAWLAGFAAAFGDGLKQADLQLWGGDTVKTPAPFIALTVHGLVPAGQMLTRSGARAGDDVYVSGTVGDGFLALQACLRGETGAAAAAYAAPHVPAALGPALRGIATAALDISDGLAADLDHLCRASGVVLQIEAENVPLSPNGTAFLDGGGALADLLGGGDDLQIAFTAPPGARAAIAAAADAAAVPVSRIGAAVSAAQDAPAAQFRDADGRMLALERRGYTHF